MTNIIVEYMPSTAMKWPIISRRAFVLLALALLSCGPLGCDRIKEAVEGLTASKKPFREKSEGFTDREKVLKKFGEPKERIGIGKAVHTENGIRYNRKWNYYYYSSAKTKTPTLRTVYFVDDAFTGSVVRQPDGTIIKEKLKFPY